MTEVIPSPQATEKTDPFKSNSIGPSSVSQNASPVANGLSTKPSSAHRLSSLTRFFSHSHSKKNEYVKEQHVVIRRKAQQELGAEASTRIVNTTFVEFLEWIRSERLTRLPHKGSAWDRVLSAAQYFAEQVHGFEAAVQDFTSESSIAAHFIFGQCLLLLEVSHCGRSS